MIPPPYRRKLVAVTQRVAQSLDYDELRDCLDHEWAIWLQSLGYVCAPIPNCHDSVLEYINVLNPSGIILSGGNNFTFDAYEQNVSHITDAYECRDLTEIKLLEYAIENSIPLLGCCRGLQLLQIFFGGSIRLLDNTQVNHVASSHEVILLDQDFQKLAKSTKIQVNSYHNFGFTIDEIVSQLIPFALSHRDSIVEGLFHRQYPIIGIMWHPERNSLSPAFDRLLINKLFS